MATAAALQMYDGQAAGMQILEIAVQKVATKFEYLETAGGNAAIPPTGFVGLPLV